MSILIEKQVGETGTRSDTDTWTVTAAVLPSGKVLSVEDNEMKDTIQQYVDNFGPDNKYNYPYNDESEFWPGENKFFEAVLSIYRSPTRGDFWIIEDPQEARKMIQEAGLK